jgi:hypothetical protein
MANLKKLQEKKFLSTVLTEAEQRHDDFLEILPNLVDSFHTPLH